MNGVKKNALTRAREEFVWDMRCKGYTERRIAAEMEKRPELQGPISQPAVHKIIKRVENRVLLKLNADVEMRKRRSTALLEQNISDLRDAYEKSTQAQVYQKKKTSGGKGGAGSPAVMVQDEVGQKTLVGDHSILREIRETDSEIRKIWGVDAPTKSEAIIHGDMHVTGQDLSALSDEELETLRALQQKLASHTKQAAGSTGSAT